VVEVMDIRREETLKRSGWAWPLCSLQCLTVTLRIQIMEACMPIVSRIYFFVPLLLFPQSN
jgi:hypothetical protein